jgi:hypothetical protein
MEKTEGAVRCFLGRIEYDDGNPALLPIAVLCCTGKQQCMVRNVTGK